jgi:hypothetical protein
VTTNEEGTMRDRLSKLAKVAGILLLASIMAAVVIV